ncbi:DUF861 domain-containing protein [Microbacterium sp. ISL-103]|uniref:cupin domain-containing protein n=1 Tax=Microbacterium sp. ISL-103 TaxID=2819156 RepID=UPI001BE88908|nr:cupin domain-containing protein [Microbacterium sp. ISL-103]MBT2474920.1 DUF861 domain-containing protein [Microbacterium sp. ISL-103]
MTFGVHALEPFVPIDLTAIALTDVIGAASEASTSSLVLPLRTGGEGDVWEMEPGHLYDTEADEVFLVLSGEARITLLSEENEELRHITVHPGTICRLTEGMRTRWETNAPLRKLYLLPADDEDRP